MRKASHQQLDKFLQNVERRAFRIAQVATKSDADALDIVQDTMIKLASKYGDRDESEWRPLFFRILENSIMDWHRKETVMRKIFFWKKDKEECENTDSVINEEHTHSHDGEAELISDQLGKHLLKHIVELPLKQQQCFMLRSWEGLSIKETAEAMNINENSVKTHYSRAIDKLKKACRDIEQQGG